MCIITVANCQTRENIAAKCSYATVEINNQPKGLFVVMEKINTSLLGLDKNDSLALLFKDPPVFYKQKLPYVQDTANYYHQKYPKIHRSDMTCYIERFKDFIFNSTDETFRDSIGYWVDIENIIDWHILLLFTNNGDGVMKNFYLYKLNSDTPFRICIWDYDHSFGRDGDNERNMIIREIGWRKSILLDRLMTIPGVDYKTRLKNRWFELRKQNIISLNNLKKHISDNHKIIKHAVEENAKIWPYNSIWYYDENDYPEEISLMIEFIKLRIGQLDEYFKYL